MTWENFLTLTRPLPVIDTEGLLTGKTDASGLRVQLARWHKAGKLIQVKKGYYLLAEPYRKTAVFEFFVSALLKSPSYISLEKALEFHGLIPEGVPIYTALTPKRPNRFTTPLGTFDYRHIQQDLFWGYQPVRLHHQTGYVATAEKALLDFIYFYRQKPTQAWLENLRLQNLQKLSLKKLKESASRFQLPRIDLTVKLLVIEINSFKRKEKKL